MIVLKFGASSLASAASINEVRKILASYTSPYLVVVSAFQGSTQQLSKMAQMALSNDYRTALEDFQQKHLKICQSLFPLVKQAEIRFYIQQQCDKIAQLCTVIYSSSALYEREKAAVIQYGALLASSIVHRAFTLQGLSLQYVDSRKLIISNDNYLNAVPIQNISFEKLQGLDPKKSYVVPDAIATNISGHPTCLTKQENGSTTAVFAVGMQASSLHLWSGIDKIYSANPQFVPQALVINQLSFQEAYAVAPFFAKEWPVSLIRSIVSQQIPLILKNTHKPQQAGTYIGPSQASLKKLALKNISSIPKLSILTVKRPPVVNQKTFMHLLLSCLKQAKIDIHLVTQACTRQNIIVVIADKEVQHAYKVLVEIVDLDQINSNSNYTLLTLIGDALQSSAGINAQVLRVLNQNNIHTIAHEQAAFDGTMQVLIDQKQSRKALHVLHDDFVANSPRTIHLFIAGLGNVGQKFIDLVEQQQANLLDQQLRFKIVGIANSKKYYINQAGIAAADTKNLPQLGTTYNDMNRYSDQIKAVNLPWAVFIDNTAASVVAKQYINLLQHRIAVVTCNKIACSDRLDDYEILKKTALKNPSNFLYETTVASALPVIKIIRDLIDSGDCITEIKAVLSGSLNFIFEQYKGDEVFASVVERAVSEGYTEPNPLIDLSGIDVKRKILILAREANYPLEMSSIESQSFLPPACLDAPNKKQLLQSLRQHEAHFNALYEAATAQNCRLMFVATFQNKHAKVGLEAVPPESALYHLNGKDNIVSIQSERYPDEPFVIKGAGAGAALTASGVFADILRFAQQ